MKELIREIFELWCRMRWLKTISREYKKLHKYLRKYQHHSYVLNALNERYNELYRHKKESE